MLKWIRVKNIQPYIKSEDFPSIEEDPSLIRRLYSADGKKYPLLCIAIYPDIDYQLYDKKLSGVRISVSNKTKKNDCWDSYTSVIPVELFSDLEEMLAEVKLKANE